MYMVRSQRTERQKVGRQTAEGREAGYQIAEGREAGYQIAEGRETGYQIAEGRKAGPSCQGRMVGDLHERSSCWGSGPGAWSR